MGGKSGQQGAESAPQSEVATGGTEPPDPLLPEMDPTDSQSEDLVFEESRPSGAEGAASSEAAGSESAAGAEMADAGAESGGMAEAGGGSTDPASDPMSTAGGDPMAGGEIAAEVRAAQEALIEAGIKLQTAGGAVADASSPEDLARAQELLAEARLIVILAGQDLMEARESGEGDSSIYDEAEQALNEANAAIVVATQSVQGMPEFEDLQTAGIPAGGGELDDELEDSLGDFDKKILTARRTVLQPGNSARENELPPAEGDMQAGIPGSAEEPGLTETDGGIDGPPEPGSLPVQRSGEVTEVAVAETPEDIGPGNDDDIVAQQLREAALSETDPELREKLWEEYRRYKSGL